MGGCISFPSNNQDDGPKLQRPIATSVTTTATTTTTPTKTTTTSSQTTTTTSSAPLPPSPPQIDDDEYQHWLSKVKSDPMNLKDAPDKDFVHRLKQIDDYWFWKMERTHSTGVQDVLKDAPEHIRNNKDIVMAAVQNDGMALKYASPDMRNDKQVVMVAVKEDGWALEFASLELQNDKEVALAAVKNKPDAIKIILGDLKKDADILIAAGMYDENYDTKRQQNTHARKIALSTRFSLDPTSWSQATNFTALFKKSKFFQEGNFIVYAPNAFDKKTCDPEWTRFDHPCRGTIDTCQYNNALTDEGHPTDDCCWRYSFRSQLQEAKDTGGCMLQLVETGNWVGDVEDAALGMGQTIELDMANTMGTKVFQVYRPESHENGYEYPFEGRHIDVVTTEISRWYNNNCQDMSAKIIRQPY